MSKITRFLAVIFMGQSFLFATIAHADQLALPSGDIIAPQISHEPLKDSIKNGSSQKIQATVTDNVAIKSVTLFYRSEGAEGYKRTQMNKAANSDVYATTLGPEDTTGDSIQYYIQAVDSAGNALLHGHSFSPLTVGITSAVAQNTSEPTTSEAEPESASASFDFLKNTNKWVWVGLGVAVVAALAGGGGSDDPQQTGTVTFTGNVPATQ